MNILILGETPFIGTHVRRYLTEWGHAVTSVQEDDARLPLRHADYEAAPPDVVIDLRSGTVTDAQSLMETFDGLAQRVVVVSSVDVYRAYGRLRRTEPGPPDLVPLLEDDPLRELPVTEDAARDHVAIERVVPQYPKLPATILRLPTVYGPDDQNHTLFPFLRRMDDHRPAILLERNYAQWRFPSGYSEDMAYAVAQAARNKKTMGRVYNVADAFAFTMTDWVRAIGRAADWDGQVIATDDQRLPADLAPAIDTEQQWIVDSSRIRQELGYSEQVLINEAMRRAVAWERENPPLDFDPAQFDYAAEDAILAGL